MSAMMIILIVCSNIPIFKYIAINIIAGAATIDFYIQALKAAPFLLVLDIISCLSFL